ncbi:HVA22-like protein i [Lathyrus oleraceus]|uniref:HVA22-like protein i n=1 Tax=Pisum sativum TaxID=3888 RepID=UPI0021D3A389|nr:HVA22-like protein i [Pisum sativum]
MIEVSVCLVTEEVEWNVVEDLVKGNSHIGMQTKIEIEDWNHHISSMRRYIELEIEHGRPQKLFKIVIKIIVALFTVLEKFLDIFIAWLPMYGEVKLVFFVYMWYPKTKGTSYIYETVLRPYVSRHENDIDRTLQEWKARGWDYAIFYWQYCAQFGHTAFVQFLQQLASQSSKFTTKSNIPVNSPF